MNHLPSRRKAYALLVGLLGLVGSMVVTAWGERPVDGQETCTTTADQHTSKACVIPPLVIERPEPVVAEPRLVG